VLKVLNSVNACYHSVQNLLELILPAVLYGCEMWSLTLKEEHGLEVSESRVLRRILRPRRDEVVEAGEDCMIKPCMIHNISLR